MDVRERKKVAFAKLRDLQGTPLAILFAMLIERKPVTKNFLAMILQRDKKTIGKSVDFLEFEGYIKRVHYRAWALPSGQLSLPGFEIGLLNTTPPALSPGQDQMDGENEVGSAASERGKNPLSGDEGAASVPGATSAPGDGGCECWDRKNHLLDGEEARKGKNSPFEGGNSPLSGTTTTTYVDAVEKDVVVSMVQAERGKNPLSAEVEAALREVRINGRGIGRNLWAKLGKCEWVGPRYLRAMAAWVNNHPDPKKRNTGFFIHCVLCHDPEPEWCEACGEVGGGHTAECSRYEPDYRKYVEGKYADLIEY